MEQKQKQGTPGADIGGGPLESGGDDLLSHMAKAAKQLANQPAPTAVDPRRSMNIDVRMVDPIRTLLYVNGTLWAEVDWSDKKKAFCIQDCLGYCLHHVEHVMKEISTAGSGDGWAHRIATGNHTSADGARLAAGMDKAIEVAKQMIRDGTMRSPEEAHEFAVKNNTTGSLAPNFNRDLAATFVKKK